MGEQSAIFDGWPPSFNRVVERGLYELPELRCAREAPFPLAAACDDAR